MIKKIMILDWIGLILIISIGYFLDSKFPSYDWLPRFGALCVVAALLVAGSNSSTVNYVGFDGQDISSLPSIDASKEEFQVYKNAENKRKASAEKARDALFIRVPFWAIIGTLTWAFGDLI